MKTRSEEILESLSSTSEAFDPNDPDFINKQKDKVGEALDKVSRETALLYKRLLSMNADALSDGVLKRLVDSGIDSMNGAFNNLKKVASTLK